MIFNSSKYNSAWDTKPLSALGEFKRGKSRHRPRNDKKLFENGIYPLVQTGEVKAANLYIRTHDACYNDFGLSQSALWPENTLCITIAANIAETALLGYPMCFPDSIVGFNADFNESSELFMHYVFTYIRKAIQNSASGSIQDNINIEYLTGLRFKIPKKEYQDKIVAILSSLDKKIELNNRINAELEAMAKTLYDYWFLQFDFPDANGQPYKTSGGKMVYNQTIKREIPEGWDVSVLADWIKNDKTGDWGKDIEEGNYTLQVDCIRGADINGINGNGKVDSPNRFILPKNDHKLLSPFDFVIEISGGSPTQSTGRMACITEDVLGRFKYPLICSNFCKAISLRDNEFFYCFAYLWGNLYDNGVLFGWEGKTSGIKNLLFDAFVNKYFVAVPSKDVAEKFFEFASPIQKKKQNLLKENAELEKLRDWILPMLMNGQISPKNRN